MFFRNQWLQSFISVCWYQITGYVPASEASVKELYKHWKHILMYRCMDLCISTFSSLFIRVSLIAVSDNVLLMPCKTKCYLFVTEKSLITLISVTGVGLCAVKHRCRLLWYECVLLCVACVARTCLWFVLWLYLYILFYLAMRQHS